ncbi:MAG: hypothetical protein N2Z59_00130 [Alteraurantiacibacter sp.]|nr:hypothetical protein [Alteraurantiacibacter sp.]
MFKNFLASVAAAGLIVAPIAAQANTRASDSAVSLAPLASMIRTASPVGMVEQQEGGMSELLLVALFGLAGVGIIVAIEESETDSSAGAGN